MKNRKLFVSIMAGLLACLMVITLLLSALPVRARAATSSDIRKEINDLEAQAAEIEAKQSDLQEQISQNDSDIDATVAEKNAIDQEIFLLNQQIDNTTARIQRYNTLISDKQAELDEALLRQEELNEEYKLRIRAMEENGRLSYWSILFKANSFLDLLDQINMVAEISKRDQEMLDELEAVAQEIQEDQESLEADKLSIEAARAELEASQAELDEKRVRSDEILVELADKADELEEYYAKMDEEKLALSNSIAAQEAAYTEQLRKEQEEELRKQNQNKPNHSDDGGETPTLPPIDYGNAGSGFMWPSDYRNLTSYYGWRNPTLGNGGWHTGIDIGAPYGTPIYASKSGVVTTAVESTVSYGNHVVINHMDGSSTLYAHMSYFVVSSGQSVSQGQVIGYVGSTGNSTGPHLHFTIYINKSTVNPLEYL